MTGAPTARSGVWTLALAKTRVVAAATRWLEFERPAAVEVEPGQFFMLSPASPSGVVFIGRPFSIGDVRGGGWRFLLRALGRGTSWLGSLEAGTQLNVVGPLGRPFRRKEAPVHRIVAGGIGLAPFFYLARRLRAEQPAARVELFYGERTAASHTRFDADEASLFDRAERFTDDGSAGATGTVVEALAGRADPSAAWYACGPQPMLRSLAVLFEERGITGAQFSLEERMACGFGVCQACIVPIREPPPLYRLLCIEGPVLDPRAVAW